MRVKRLVFVAILFFYIGLFSIPQFDAAAKGNTLAVKKSNVTVVNNEGNYEDYVYVKNVKKGSKVIVYGKNKRKIGSKTAKQKGTVKLNVQLSSKASYIYVALQDSKKKVSSKVKILHSKDGIFVKDIEVPSITVEMKVGRTYQLSYSIKPANATNKKVSFKTDSKKLSVNSKGFVTAKAEGEAEVSINSVDGFADTSVYFEIYDNILKLKPAQNTVNNSIVTLKGTVDPSKLVDDFYYVEVSSACAKDTKQTCTKQYKFYPEEKNQSIEIPLTEGKGDYKISLYEDLNDDNKLTDLEREEKYIVRNTNEGYYAYNSTLYLNGEKASGTKEYKDKLYINGWLASGKEEYNNKLYIEGVLASGTKEYKDKLYIDGVLASGTKEYKDELYIDGILASGIKEYNNKLYIDGILATETQVYNDTLYINGEIVGGYHLFNNILYDGSKRIKGYLFYKERLYYNGEVLYTKAELKEKFFSKNMLNTSDTVATVFKEFYDIVEASNGAINVTKSVETLSGQYVTDINKENAFKVTFTINGVDKSFELTTYLYRRPTALIDMTMKYAPINWDLQKHLVRNFNEYITGHSYFYYSDSISKELIQKYGTYFEDTVIPKMNQYFLKHAQNTLIPTQVILGDENDIDLYGQVGSVSKNAYGWVGNDNVAVNTMEGYTAPYKSVNTVLLPHEYVHWIFRNVYRANIPSILNEGFAYSISQAIAYNKSVTHTSYFAKAVNKVKVSGLSDTWYESNSNSSSYEGSIVATYLLDQYSGEKLDKFLIALNGQSFEEALQSTLGITVAELTKKVRAAYLE